MLPGRHLHGLRRPGHHLEGLGRHQPDLLALQGHWALDPTEVTMHEQAFLARMDRVERAFLRLRHLQPDLDDGLVLNFAVTLGDERVGQDHREPCDCSQCSIMDGLVSETEEP